MAYEQRNNTASMFKNDRKKSETHADWQGTALIDGREYYLNAWTKSGKNGDFYSLTFKEKGAPKPYVSDDAPF
jgi:hypothetical protein